MIQTLPTIVIVFTVLFEHLYGLSSKDKNLLAEIAVCVVGGRADLTAFAFKTIKPISSAPKQNVPFDFVDDIPLNTKYDIHPSNGKPNTDPVEHYLNQMRMHYDPFESKFKKNPKYKMSNEFSQPTNLMNANDWKITDEYPKKLQYRHLLDGLSQEPNLDMIRYQQTLNEAPKVYDMKKGNYYRQYGQQQINAEQELNKIMSNYKHKPSYKQSKTRGLTLSEKMQLQYDMLFQPDLHFVDLESQNLQKIKAKVYNMDTNSHYDLISDKHKTIMKRSKISSKKHNKIKVKNTGKTRISKGNKQQITKQLKIQNLKQQLKFSTTLSVGMSAVININLLLQGQIVDYLSSVMWDAGVAAVITSCEVGLEETVLESVSPGIGVAIFAVIDVANAFQTGDWERVALNLGLNVGSTVGALGGGYVGGIGGAAIGSAVPIIGTAIGGVIGGVIGAIGGAVMSRGTLSIITPLGKMTTHEANKMKKELAKKLNPGLEEFGLKLDDSKDLNEILELLKKEDVPVIATEEFVKAKDVSYSQIAQLYGDDLLQNLLKEAKLLSTDIGEGLKELKNALGC
eukprot:513833_1